MSHLFATTDLERSYRVNMNVLGLDGRPGVRARRPLAEWLTFREATVRRRLQHRFDRIAERLHVLDALLVAYLNVDEVIKIVREADSPKAALMARFSLTEAQANAILELRLRQLARLEQIRIEGNKRRSWPSRTISENPWVPRRLRTLMRKELAEAAERYGDDRRSPLVTGEEARAFTEEERLSSEPITVIVSEMGWVRAAKGHELDPRELAYRSGDQFAHMARGRSNEPLVVFDSTGRAYTLPAHGLPSARSQGEPLTGRLTVPSGASFAGLMMASADSTVLMASSAGYGFLCRLGDLVGKQKAGKAVLTLPEGALVLPPQRVEAPESDLLVAVSSAGRMLVFPVSELPALARGKGNKILSLPKASVVSGEEVLRGVVALPADGVLRVHAGARYLEYEDQ